MIARPQYSRKLKESVPGICSVKQVPMGGKMDRCSSALVEWI